MSNYCIYTDKGIPVADIVEKSGDYLITNHDGRWDYNSGRRWVFADDLAYTAPFHQVRIYIFRGYYMRKEDY